MSFVRQLIPMGLAVAFGVWTGVYAFQPAFKGLQDNSQQQQTSKNNQQKPEADTELSR
ncbi:hypothetical protein GGS26DRAFT_593278 [Hypomontagnella submonticulosa]|nr:hypothetical protein GGS26DRAFT_593278 [Hypomontagnella submonticulosa]